MIRTLSRLTTRHPLLRAWALEWANRAGRARQSGWLYPIIIAVTLAAFLIAVLATRYGEPALRTAGAHLTVVGVLIALPVSVWVQRQRQWWTLEYRDGWLATVPVAPGSVRRAIALRSLVMPWTLLSILLCAVWLAAEFSNEPVPLAPLLSVCLMGSVGGSILGWCLPRVAAESGRPDSHRAAIAAGEAPPSLKGLSYLPLSQARVWMQPRSIVRLVLPAMLILPMNASGNVAVALVAACVLMMYLCVLLRATLHVVRESAAWLRPTPLPLNRFAWAVLRYPLLKQLQWTLLGTILIVALGTDGALVLRSADIWLAMVATISSVATTQAYKARGAGLRIVISLGALAVIEYWRRYTALPCSLLLCAWQFRKEART